MKLPGDGTLSTHALGGRSSRRTLALGVLGITLLASSGFAVGIYLHQSVGWLGITVAMAVLGGYMRAGLLPTIGSQWLLFSWWFVYPPLYGYLTGTWGDTPSNHPRVLAYAYPSARAELLGGIDYAIQYGLLLALLFGLIGYATGTLLDRPPTQPDASV